MPHHPRVPDLAAVGKALADASRAAMVLALMDGRAWTVGELAHAAGVARNTASGHADRLVAAGLAVEIRQGRHRYLTIADQRVADAVESLGTIVPTVAASPTLRAQRADAELVAGRTCYRHLAGRLGVRITDHWQHTGIVGDDWTLTERGRKWFADVHVQVPDGRRRPLIRPCLDWTERRPHAAGALADAFASHGLEHGWFRRGSHPRAITITAPGTSALQLPADAEPTTGRNSTDP